MNLLGLPKQIHRLDGFNNRNSLTHSLEAGSPKFRNLQVWHLPRHPSPWLANGRLQLPAHAVFVCLCGLIATTYKGTGHMG